MSTLFILAKIFLVLVVFPISMLCLLVCALCFLPRIWEKIKYFWYWFCDFDFIFGESSQNSGYFGGDNNRNIYRKNKNEIGKYPRTHTHNWDFVGTSKHNWAVLNGILIGEHREIDKVIKAVRDNPGHTETDLHLILGWKIKGAEVVYTSWNKWKCSICNALKHTEYYTAPGKLDGKPIDIITDNIGSNRFNKKTTQQITTINTFSYKREVPVEKLKRYTQNG